MNKTFKHFFTLVFAILAFNASAQSWDCDCEGTEVDEGVCAVVSFDFEELDSLNAITIWAPSECYLDCLEASSYEIVNCDDVEIDFEFDIDIDDEWEDEEGEDEWADCDCEEDFEEGVCLAYFDEFVNDTITCWFPSECWADCFGVTDYVVVDCEEWTGDDWDDEEGEDEWVDCDCEEDFEEGVCLLFVDEMLGDTITTWFPSECWADCFGVTDYVVVDCEEWTGDDWDDEEGEDEWVDCECEEDFGEGVCLLLVDEMFGDTLVEWFPSVCWAECFGVTDFVEVACEEWTGEEDCDDEFADCECDEENIEEGICITFIDTLLNEEFTTWVPSECHADCFGFVDYTVVDCDDFEWGEGDDWEEEEWEGEDWEFSDSTFVIGDCEFTFTELETVTLQDFMGLLEECGVELPLCITEAPAFDTDEEYIAYIEANCEDGGFFLMGSPDGSTSLMDEFNGLQAQGTSSNLDIFKNSNITLISNVVADHLDIISNSDLEGVTIQVVNLSGQMLMRNQYQQINANEQVEITLPANMINGNYVVQLSTSTGVKAFKFVVGK